MSIKVYTKHNCMQCNYTKEYLDNNKIPYESVNIEHDNDALEEVTALGYTSMPVVKVGDYHFGGFRPDKLVKLK